MKRYSKSKIDRALELLEEAAQDKKKELIEHIGGKYANVKNIFTHELKNSDSGIRHAVSDALERGEELIKDKYHKGEDIYHHIDKAVRKNIRDVDKRVTEDPYSYIVGVGLASMAVGYLIAKIRSKGAL